MNIEQMCSDAQSRVSVHINRSTGQHLRALKSKTVSDAYYKSDAPTSADIYAMAMESETADRHIKWLCKMAGVDFPPVNEGVPA